MQLDELRLRDERLVPFLSLPDDLWETIKLLFRAVFIIMVLFLIASYFLALVLGPMSFFLTEQGRSVSGLYPEQLPIMFFTVIAFGIPAGFNFGTLFLSLSVAYAACFVVAWRFHRDLHQVIKSGFLHSIRKLFDNFLLAMPLIASMLLTAVIFVQGLQESQGVPTGQAPLPDDPFKAFFWLAYAPLVEELGFRISPIGTVLIFYLLSNLKSRGVEFSWIEKLRILILAPLFPERAKGQVGVKTVRDYGLKQGISLGEWIALLCTSIVFGLVHYLFSGGWGVGKVTSASMAGLVLGLTYLVYGFQAPILLHWFFNYYFTAFEVATELHPNLASLASMFESTIVLLGLAGWISCAILAVHRSLHTVAEGVE